MHKEANMDKKADIKGAVEGLMQGIHTFISSKTVVGAPIEIEGAHIIPLVDVSFGMASGSFVKEKNKNDSQAGGVTGKVEPSAVLIVKDGNVRLVNVKNQDTVSKLIDVVPDLISKVNQKKKEKESEDVKSAVSDVIEENRGRRV